MAAWANGAEDFEYAEDCAARRDDAAAWSQGYRPCLHYEDGPVGSAIKTRTAGGLFASLSAPQTFWQAPEAQNRGCLLRRRARR